MKTLTNLFIRLFLLTAITTAQWSSDPSLPQLIGTGVQSQVAPTSDGGVYIAWLTDGNYHVYIQRLDATGEAQLDESGLLVSDNNNASWIAVFHLNLAVDGNDNAIITTVDQRTGTWEVYAWKIAPDGSMLWGQDGVALTNSGLGNMSPRVTILPDNSAVVTWTHNDNSVLFQRISSDGTLLWGDGILMEDDDANLLSPQPIITMEGDVLIQWIRQSGAFPWAMDSELYLQKYDYDSNPQWSDSILAAGPVVFPMGNWSQQLVAEASGGSFLAWTQMSGNVQNAVAQLISVEGVPVWTGGVDLSTNSSNFRMSPMLSIAEETQELIAVWKEANGSQSQRGIFAQRLDSSGNQLWGSTGTTVVALNSSYDYLDLSVAGFGEEIISTYIQQSADMSGDIYTNRLDAEGNSVWTEETVTVTNSGMAKSDMVTGKGPNCLFITWSENGSVFAHCLLEDGTLGAPDVGSSDCTADDGTDGVELWGECYSIENTTNLDLSYSDLSGEIPPEIGNLTNLTFLNLGINQLTGSIPSGIGNLTNLTALGLHANQLTGSIPSEIGNLTNLGSLNLDSNQLTGSIPSGIGNLTNLGSLNLGNNELTGEIPPEIGNLTSLDFSLDLSRNELTGEIPPEIGNLTNLEYLNLDSNQLTGEIPPEIGNLTNLIVLRLYDNQFTGELPPELWTLEIIEYLSIDRNQLTGEIPPEIGQLMNLQTLWLSENSFTGSIPSELFTLPNLSRVYLFNNQITGEIPSEIGDLETLTRVYLFDNQITGEIPSEIGYLTNLEGLKLHTNQLTGTIPETLCDLSNLTWSLEDSSYTVSTLFDNQLCPPYPSCIEEYVGNQDTSGCGQVSIIDETLPMTYDLHNAYPNPFNPVTTLRYDLPENAMVNITIYDMMGRVVSNLVSSQQRAGYKSVRWSATNNTGQPVSAGLYLYTIEVGQFRQTKKMVLLK